MIEVRYSFLTSSVNWKENSFLGASGEMTVKYETTWKLWSNWTQEDIIPYNDTLNGLFCTSALSSNAV